MMHSGVDLPMHFKTRNKNMTEKRQTRDGEYRKKEKNNTEKNQIKYCCSPPMHGLLNNNGRQIRIYQLTNEPLLP